MTTCLKYLVPISCFLFLGATVWPLALYNLTGGSAGGRTALWNRLGEHSVPAAGPKAPSVPPRAAAVTRVTHSGEGQHP